MSNQAIRDEFLDIVVWSRGAQRAPHKPLLILYALGALMRGQEKLGFIELEQPLRELLKEFGPVRQAYHPEYPFWRLRNDGVWLLDNAGHCAIRASNTDAKISELREHNVLGCFRPDIIQAFKADPLLLSDVVQAVLEAHFPDTLHSEILERCGIDLQYNKKLRNAIRRSGAKYLKFIRIAVLFLTIRSRWMAGLTQLRKHLAWYATLEEYTIERDGREVR